MKINLQKQVGFTLIEVLIALVILAIALIAVIKATQVSIRGTTRVQDRIIAHWVAMNVVAKIQSGLLSLPTQQQSLTGQQSTLQQRWRWKATVDQSGNAYYERLRVDVFQSSKKNRIERLFAFVRKPNEKITNSF